MYEGFLLPSRSSANCAARCHARQTGIQTGNQPVLERATRYPLDLLPQSVDSVSNVNGEVAVVSQMYVFAGETEFSSFQP